LTWQEQVSAACLQWQARRELVAEVAARQAIAMSAAVLDVLGSQPDVAEVAAGLLPVMFDRHADAEAAAEAALAYARSAHYVKALPVPDASGIEDVAAPEPKRLGQPFKEAEAMGLKTQGLVKTLGASIFHR